ncbi:MAG: type I-C CRISPR-associated protein Cas8c/Csd1 [Desulfomonile sp.]
MLLKALFELAKEKKLLEKVHLQPREVHFLIPINSDGQLIGDGLVPLTELDSKGKETLGRTLSMPRFPGENNGGKAHFLAEKASTILGIDSSSGDGLEISQDEKKRKNDIKSVIHYWNRIQEAFDSTNLPVLRALLEFRLRYLYDDEWRSRHPLSFVEFREPSKARTTKKEVHIRTSSSEWKPLSNNTLLCFQIDGHLVFDADPNNPLTEYWANTYQNEQFSEDLSENVSQNSSIGGLCIVTGKIGEPIARSHKPKILGIPGLTSGGYIVSFAQECPAFSSFGFTMGENAPISEATAASYALALQSLIYKDNQTLKLGNTVTCFWASRDSEEVGLFAKLLKRPDPTTVSDFLKAPWKGESQREPRPEDFYSVTLTGNAGRVVVRHWLHTTVKAAIENLKKWFVDLDIVHFGYDGDSGDPSNKTRFTDSDPKESVKDLRPLSLTNLALTTVRDRRNLHDDVVSKLYQAAVAGTPLPTSIVIPFMTRLKTDISKFGLGIFETPLSLRTQQVAREVRQELVAGKSRFAFLKLILNRKDALHMIESRVFETDDSAYNCGRLLAVISEAQAKAHDYQLEGAGVGERYFGTACVSPSSVFPLLLRLNRHHLEKIKKSEKYRSHQGFIEEQLCTIMSLFKPRPGEKQPSFPRHLDLQAQGRFALGFYQQLAEIKIRKKDAKSTSSGK